MAVASPARRAVILLSLAWRNVLRQARRSVLTASAMVLGLALLVLSRSLAGGSHESWIEAGVRLGSGHVVVQHPAYQRSSDLADRLSAAQVEAAAAALAAPGLAERVTAVTPRLMVTGLASSAESAVPALVVGVDPAREAGFSGLAGRVVEGAYVSEEERLSAFIGVGMAERLGLELGSRFVLTAQAADGEIAGQLVRVAGLFRTGVPEMDQALVHVPIETAREWLGAPGEATSVAALLRSSRDTGRAAALLGEALTGTGVAVLTWREASPELDAALRIDDWGDYIFHGILLAIVALAILNAILMSVLNRRREFGVLRALGLTARQTGAVVLAEGILLTLASGALGIALGLGVTWLFWRDGLDLSSLWGGDMTVSGAVIDPVLVPEFRLATVLFAFGWIFVIGLLASLYPARQARRFDVAESMKFER
ncbi:MAG TPA: FtsX-like permease family protein [Gemmatimonadota bacterium]